jgi:diguanylate cyclase (GGDEF)-like protein/PAS domain S-box-containing protein
MPPVPSESFEHDAQFSNPADDLIASDVFEDAISEGSFNQDLRDRQLRAFFEGALDAMVICDDEGRYMDANPAACQLFGFSREELLGQKIGQFTQPASLAETWHHMQNTERLTGELQITNADGVVWDMEFAATTHFLPHRHLVVMRDITQRKQLERSLHKLNEDLERRVVHRTAALQHLNHQLQAEIQERQQTEQALRQSRAMLGDILDRAIACIVSFRVCANGDWTYDYFSAGSQHMFGFSPAALMADKHLWMKQVEPNDLSVLLPKMYEDIYAERSAEVEYRFHYADGHLRWILSSYASRYDSEANCWVVTCVCTDISERKQVETEHKAVEAALRVSQQRLSFALESAKAGIWHWDIATHQTYWSETNYRLMGYEPGDYETTFELWQQAVHPDDRGWILERINQALAERSEIYLDYRIQLPDGTVRWLRDMGRVLVDGEGHPYAMTGIQIDITETQMVKEALIQSERRLNRELRQHRENENRFQLALEGSGDGLWDWNIETGRVLFDQRWLSMLGYGSGELAEHISTWEDLLHPDDRSWVMEELNTHLGDPNHAYKFEYRLRTKAGHWKWVANYSKVIARDSDSQPLRMVGTHRDVDERKNNEQLLQYQKGLLDSLFESTPDLIAVVDSGYCFLSFNQAYQQEFHKIFGIEIRLGTNLLNVLHHLPAEQYKVLDLWGRALAGEEFTLVREFGDTRRERNLYELTFATVRDAMGNPLGAALFARDVSDRIRAQEALQESEERFRNAFDYAGIGKALVGLQGQFLKVNQVFCQITGYSEAELLSLDFQTITHPDDLDADLALAQQLSQGEIQSYQMEKRYVHKQGHVVWVLLTGSVVRDHNGSPRYFIAQIQDMTARFTAETELRRSQTLLLEAQQVAHIGNWSFNVQTQELIWSQETYRIFGFDQAHPPITLDQHTTLIHPDDRRRWQVTVDQAIVDKQGYVIEFRALRPNGRTCVVEARGEVELDEKGDIVRLFGTVQDITKRRYLEDALRSQVQKEKALNCLLQVIRQSLDLDTIFQATVVEIGQLTSAQRVEIVKYNADRGYWRNVADYRCSTDLPSALGMEFADEGNSVAAQLKRLEVVRIEDASKIPDSVNADLATQFAGSWLLVPLHNDSHLWGALGLVKATNTQWQDSDVELLQTVASQLAIAIYQVTLYRQVQQELSSRQQMEQVLRHSAMHDSLTDLPNRHLLMSGLAFALKRSKHQPNFRFAVLFLDLDRFKLVNDSLGHLSGDQLLKVVADKIVELLRPMDLAARLGGDEFVILLDGINALADAIEVAERLLAMFRKPFQLFQRPIYITASIGIVMSSAQYQKPVEILRDADIAMYQAKAKGKNCYALFDSDFHRQAVQQLQLEHDLRQGLINQQFCLYYQPIMNLLNGKMVGFEALVRWQHPELGLVPPIDFIPLAEETGLITDLGRWIMMTACEQLQTWRQQFPALQSLKVNVNLSVEQLRTENLATEVGQILQETGLDGQYLTLEITESMLIDDTEAMIQLIDRLRTLAIKVAIDDFGTGYSSLSYLHRLPIDALKIDKSFIQEIQTDPMNQSIVGTIITLSDQLNLLAVAEGIEKVEHLHQLQAMGCEQGQGYYFSPPLPAAAVAELLATEGIETEN